MKWIRTKGRGAHTAAATLAALEQRGGAALEAVMPAVKRIVKDVRRGGDGALLRAAAKFDGQGGREAANLAALRVAPEEMAAAFRGERP